MNDQNFFKHPAMPFAECRYSENSGRHYKSHMHQTFSVGAINRGEVIYQVDGQTALLRPGSLALINPEILHSCNPTKSQMRSYYMLYLDIDWCLQLQQSLWQIETFNPVNRILLEDDLLYQQYIVVLESLMGKDDLLEKEQLLVELIERIFLQACEPAKKKNVPSLEIEQLKLQLSENLDQDISVKQLATAQQANSYTLLRHFKAATGITPHAYRLNCRIELARRLLQEGLELSQVALECGFFDQSHFHRHFKAITTVTPKEYQVNFVQ